MMFKLYLKKKRLLHLDPGAERVDTNIQYILYRKWPLACIYAPTKSCRIFVSRTIVNFSMRERLVLCKLILKYTWLVSTELTPVFGSRAFSNTTLVLFSKIHTEPKKHNNISHIYIYIYMRIYPASNLILCRFTFHESFAPTSSPYEHFPLHSFILYFVGIPNHGLSHLVLWKHMKTSLW